MQLPISWVRDFVETDAAPQTIADALTARGFTVDAVDVQPTPDRIVVGRVESLGPHPNADKLRVGIVDVGREKLQIVTGADNVAAGDKVPIALVGAVVYERPAADAKQRTTKTIQKSKLRGVESAGMMCSPFELALPGDYDDGIFIMEEGAPVGVDFWKATRFGDAVLDVDVPSNRADCLSVIGLAREAAAGLGAAFREPAWEASAGSARSPIAVEIADPGVCRRLLGQLFTGVANRRPPTWMALRLNAARVRSLNFLIDVSNFVQIETGQPLHFYDARKIRGGTIVARAAHAGESVVTLDGIERVLDEGTPVIADGERVVGIAGIFGGADAGVADDTVDVFLESPNFVGARIRRASIALSLRTEGATRHERNLPLELVELGRRRAAQLLIAAGATASAVDDVGERPGPPRTIAVRPARVNALLGTNYSTDRMKSVLAPIGIAAGGDDSLAVTVPWWRTDLTGEVDIIEEVARAIGYGDIEERRGVAAPQAVDDALYEQEDELARSCAALGYREIVSIALQGSRTVGAWERSGLPFWSGLATVVNPLSDDQRFLRPSLLPGVLSAATRVWPRADGRLKLFEIGHIFRNPGSEPESRVAASGEDGAYADNGAIEWPSLCGLAAFGDIGDAGALDRRLLELKGDAEWLVSRFTPSRVETIPEPRAYFHPGAAGNLVVSDRTVAKFGRIHPSLARAYELPEATYAFFLYMENLPRMRPVRPFAALPKFPGTRRDLALVVGEEVAAGQLMQAIRAANVPAFEDVRAFDEYVGPQVENGKKSVALAVMLRRMDATITDAEADASVNALAEMLREKFDAVVRGPALA